MGATPAAERLEHLFAGKYAAMLGGGEAGLKQWRNTFSLPVLVTVSRVVAWTRSAEQLRYRSVP